MQKITICSQIKNRLHQFTHTLNHNLNKIYSYDNVNWNIVDINSSDGLEEFIRPYISDKIRYYKCIDTLNYSIPIAKNLSVRLSDGDYVFNLDIDNFLDSAIDSVISNNFTGIYCNVFKKGVFGRIGCSRSIFKEMRGYDESFDPAAYHEPDFINRCSLVNYRFTHIDCKAGAILNSKIDTVKNTNSDKTWEEMLIANKKISDNISRDINNSFQECKFLYNFQEEITLPSTSFD